jgi:hypothetical protein
MNDLLHNNTQNCQIQKIGQFINIDIVLAAINSYEKREERGIPRIMESRLMYVNRFFPEWCNKLLIQKEFTKPVVFLSPEKYE